MKILLIFIIFFSSCSIKLSQNAQTWVITQENKEKNKRCYNGKGIDNNLYIRFCTKKYKCNIGDTVIIKERWNGEIYLRNYDTK